MSLLVDVDWQLSYTPDDGDLVRIFYVPALSAATRYDRTTGYFSARALAPAARGVEGLVANNGRMRMIVGCTLDKPEIDAIAKGQSLRNAVEAALLRMPEFNPSSQDEEALELLAWMIANGHLEVKAAVPCNEQGRPATDASIFHEKTGIVEDKTGERIVFSGSINETKYGWTRNWESFHVFTSWKDPDRVADQEARFAKLWANQATHAITLDVPEAVRQRLMRFLPEDGGRPRKLAEVQDAADGDPAPEQPPVLDGPLLPDERRAAVWEKIYAAARQPVGGDRVGEATSAVVPWPHQVRAFHRMYDHWPPKLLIADEVGLGKTIQAGLLPRQAWLAGRARRILVLAPKAVCRQWQIELREKFNLSWPIDDGQKLIWLESPARKDIERIIDRARWHEEPFLIMSSHLARRLDRQREILEAAAPWDLVLLDEAHHARTSGVGTPQEKGPATRRRTSRCRLSFGGGTQSSSRGSGCGGPGSAICRYRAQSVCTSASAAGGIRTTPPNSFALLPCSMAHHGHALMPDAYWCHETAPHTTSEPFSASSAFNQPSALGRPPLRPSGWNARSNSSAIAGPATMSGGLKGGGAILVRLASLE